MTEKDDMKAAFEAGRTAVGRTKRTKRYATFERWYEHYVSCTPCKMTNEVKEVPYRESARDNIITHRTDASFPGSDLVVTDLHLSDEMRAALTIDIRPDNVSRLRHIWQKDVDATVWKLTIVIIFGVALVIVIRFLGVGF